MRISCFVLLTLWTVEAAATNGLINAIENVRSACGNISAELSDMKSVAGINTAVTGVGTLAGGVALGTGIAKSSTDKKIDDLEQQLAELIAADQEKKLQPIVVADMAKLKHDLDQYQKSSQHITLDAVQQELSQTEQKSRSLGNWRTGMLATSTATNIAGAVIAGGNKVKGDLMAQITRCLASVKVLSDVRMQTRLSKSATDSDLARAENIIHACNEWSTVDINSINKKSANATVSSTVGAGLGMAGTITSASANSEPVRADDDKKEKKLNAAANVLAGGTTLAAGLATVFNATQIGAIKRALTVAEECEEALK